METMKNFNELMFLKNFSSKTIKNYNSCVLNVSKKINKEPHLIDEFDLRSFLLGNKQYSSSTMMGIINAFKTYFTLCLDKEFNNKILPRPKVEQKQPDVLSIVEIQEIISLIDNMKHKAIFSLMYSCALRVSEVVNLKIKDLDTKNNRIVIRNGKGKVDRVVMLDYGLLDFLRKYWSEYKTKEYLFEGIKGGRYSEKSIQTFVKKYAYKAGFNKKISSHSLRHSSLTQMIKDGVDLRTVQKIAGHKNINTTAGYIKILDSDILNTESPISHIKL